MENSSVKRVSSVGCIWSFQPSLRPHSFSRPKQYICPSFCKNCLKNWVFTNWVEIAAKLRTFADADGKTLNGKNRYVLHFDKDQVPTARAFWSITVYDDKFNLAGNDFNKYLVSSTSKDLVYRKDGSLEIYLQQDQPDQALRANWIPLPEGDFNLFFRFYLPNQSMIDQSYVPPPVRRVADK